MNYVILNGINSQSLEGFLIQSLPPISKPAMRTQIEEIDGRDGDIVTGLGYAAYNKTMSIGLYGNYDIDKIIEFFNSSGTVVFSNESDKVYQYTIVEQIDFERLIRFRTANVTFHVQPFKHSLAQTALTFRPRTSSGQGETVTLNTVEGEKLRSISFYGKSAQVMPSIVNPTEIANVEGSMNVRIGETDKTVVFPELCKVGNYQDGIYKDNVWIKNTAIKKFTVDTGSIELIEMRNVTYAVFPIPVDALCYGNYKNVPCLCTHAEYSEELPEGKNSVNAVNKIFCQNDAITFWIGMTAGTTLAQAQAALTDCEIYYVLLEKLNVVIDDTDLITQLNSLMNVSLLEDSTEITVTNAVVQPDIKAVAVQQIYMVRNIGNVYARPRITIDGTGNIKVLVNGKQIFSVDMDGEITIDGAELEAYHKTTENLRNRNVTGSYDNFMLPIGRNYLEFVGDLSKVIVENYSRWL